MCATASANTMVSPTVLYVWLGVSGAPVDHELGCLTHPCATVCFAVWADAHSGCIPEADILCCMGRSA